MLFERLGIKCSSFFIEGLIILLVAPWLLFPGISPLVTSISLLSLAALFLVSWSITRRPLRPSPLNGVILIWALTFLVSILVSADASLTIPKATGLFLGFSLWYLVVNNVNSRVELKWALALFFLAGIGVTVAGVLGADWRLKIPIFQEIFSSEKIFPRIITFPGGPDSGIHTNQLAGVFTLYFPILLAILMGIWTGKRGRFPLIFSLIGFIILSMLLLLTQSRSAWIGGVVGLMTLLLLWARFDKGSGKRRLYIIGFVLLLLFIIVGSIWLGPDRLAKLWDDPRQSAPLGGFGTVGFRQEVWHWAVVAIGDFPFTGTGLGTFREVVRRLYPLNVPSSTDIAHAHNLFLQLALDFGILGLITYLALFGLAFSLAWRVAVRSKEFRPLAIGIIAGLAAYHVYSLTDALAPGSKPTVILWLLIGILIALDRFTMVEDRRTGPYPCQMVAKDID